MCRRRRLLAALATIPPTAVLSGCSALLNGDAEVPLRLTPANRDGDPHEFDVSITGGGGEPYSDSVGDDGSGVLRRRDDGERLELDGGHGDA